MKKIFVSYSHRNMDWVAEDGKYALISWLSKQLRSDDIIVWTDHALNQLTGAEYNTLIESEIQQADMAIMMISQDFMASDYIMEKEVPLIKERWLKGELKLFPLLLTPISGRDKNRFSWIFNFKIYPNETTPLINYFVDEVKWEKSKVEILDNVFNRLEENEAPPKLKLEAPKNTVKFEPEDLAKQRAALQLEALLKEFIASAPSCAVKVKGKYCSQLFSYLPEASVEKLVFYGVENNTRPTDDSILSALYAPAEIKAGDSMIVQVFLYKSEESDQVELKAKIVDKDAEILNYKPLDIPLKIGDKVVVMLKMPKGVNAEKKKILTWMGHYTSCEFAVSVNKKIDMETLIGKVVLSVNQVPIGEMSFKTKITDFVRDNIFAEVLPRAYRKIFISYSHKDSNKVKFIAAAYQPLIGLDYFFDRHSLKPGDIYKEKIYNYIDEADLFILCWSKNAAQSEWVAIEKNRALECKQSKNPDLFIYPLNIVPKTELPEDMKEIYDFGEI